MAIVALKKALSLCPEENGPVTALADIYNSRKDYDAAIDLYKELQKVSSLLVL